MGTLFAMTIAADPRPPALLVQGVGKTFRIPEERLHTLKERALHPLRRQRYHELRVLNEIDFRVEEGEFFGLAGRNGSGKSTLLKCLAGIYGAEGRIWRRGRVSTLIELGVGFNPELAARDNVIVNGIMMGLSPREARARYDSVIDFAELDDYQDLKLKNYSSGMQIRLAFSVAVHVNADILLVDEILAVGDAAFQQKCFDVFNRLRDEGKTIVFVTHDMAALQRFCHRALLLERGSMVRVGTPDEVAHSYLELNFARPAQAEGEEVERGGDGDARVVEVWVEDEQGQRQFALPQGQRVTAHARVRFHADLEDPQMSIYVQNEDHRTVMVLSTSSDPHRVGSYRAGEEAVFSFTFTNVLGPGRYNPVVFFAHWGSGVDVIDRYEGAPSFLVTSTSSLGGLVDVPVDVAVSRPDHASAQRASAST